MEGELAWQRFLRRRIEPFVNVGDEEVKSILDRLKEAQGTEEYHLHEIFLAATPDQAQQVFANAQRLIGEIQKGQAPFSYFARNFSEATTRGVGGELDWVRRPPPPAELSRGTLTPFEPTGGLMPLDHGVCCFSYANETYIIAYLTHSIDRLYRCC